MNYELVSLLIFTNEKRPLYSGYIQYRNTEKADGK